MNCGLVFPLLLCMSVGNDRMVEMFSFTLYILMFCLVVYERVQRAKRANEVSDSPALELSPTLVLALTCLTVAPLALCPR